jgi:uncharacterized protein YndB with AHSA1/START domain
MMSKTDGALSYERTIRGKPKDVFYAFSTPQGWRDWLCDAALFRAYPGGSYHLSWDTGWHAAGSVKKLEKGNQLELTWHGKGDPADTAVSISLQSEGEHTRLELIHTGFGEGEAWDDSRAQAAHGWEIGLENLESIFDSGADLRVTRRPMLGIMGSDFNEQIAEKIGVPVKEGIRIGEAVEGMGPAKAGMQGGDVLVEMDNTPIRDWPDLSNVLQRHQAGDRIGVSYYRGSERHDVEMELSARPIEETPLEPERFAESYREVTAKALDELKTALEGVSESEADYAPEGEWSIKENIAHLIEVEEANAVWFRNLVSDNEPQYGDPWENRLERYKAVVRVTPTLEQLVARLAQAQEELACMIEECHEKLSRRKGVMWRAGLSLLHYPGEHEREHIGQMQKTLEQAREAGQVAEPA